LRAGFLADHLRAWPLRRSEADQDRLRLHFGLGIGLTRVLMLCELIGAERRELEDDAEAVTQIVT
jgi:hypothetical protein